jgi:site-specific recombinase XerD
MAVNQHLFFEHIDAFFNYRQDIYKVSEQTSKSNRVDLDLFKTFIQANGYEAISGPAVMQFQYYLKNDRNNSGGSINRKIFTLRSYSHFLTLMDVPGAQSLPFYDVLKIRQGYRNRPNALTVDQMCLLFETICRDTVLGIRDYAVYALMYQTGLRVGEVHHLDLDCLDFKNHKLLVTGKGGKRRELHMTAELGQILSEWLAVRPFVHQSEQHNAVFISKKGNRLAIRTMEDNFKKLLAASSLDLPFKVSCHTLRHSFASHLNDKDVDILIIQSLLGHASTRSTEPYIHPSLGKVRHAMEKLPAVVFINQLLKTGALKLKFQRNRIKKE